MEWTSARIRLFREVGLCLPQDKFAKAVGFTKRTIGNAERGAHPPSLALRRALDDALENASDAQRDRFFSADHDAAPVLHGAMSAAFPALNFDELRHLTAAMDNASRYLDGDAVQYFQRQLTSCTVADGMEGPRRTLPVVLGVLAVIEQHTRQVKPDVRRDLLTVGARGAEFAGWLYRDAHRPDLASNWRDRAAEWAQGSRRLADGRLHSAQEEPGRVG